MVSNILTSLGGGSGIDTKRWSKAWSLLSVRRAIPSLIAKPKHSKLKYPVTARCVVR